MSVKWAVVTGASGGIGLECARVLAQRGYNLVLVARSASNLDSAQKALATPTVKVVTISLNLATDAAATKLVEQTDALGIIPEVLVNNAGVGCHGKFFDTPLSEQINMLRLNTEALIALSYLYGKKMRERKHGYILQVASTAAFQPIPYMGLYAATKSLVVSFSRSLNFEYQAQGVTSTVLCPGPTATKFFDEAKFTPGKEFAQLMMPADVVAKKGIDAMFARRDICVAGTLNKIVTFFPRFVPVRFIMGSMEKVMK
ncbi:MAG: SDR family oxidoreductase [Proteobacteria bacterium]|nr:SDR family oxidoreductase [Pseudomonadota bacterium]